eukprot:CAMPEP_0173270808 /NCGR_PEP_ID=MMETSP1143-20121109/452_1 /TAXON_ID=483371 /ORGANISM="non described non described, Strain CCMP2298" /LENGTH=103 /DNA_ID=CAMNT_0014207273 /DNA_START=387 /DNA_END=698 /DNA_ORIENTATION=-
MVRRALLPEVPRTRLLPVKPGPSLLPEPRARLLPALNARLLRVVPACRLLVEGGLAEEARSHLLTDLLAEGGVLNGAVTSLRGLLGDDRNGGLIGGFLGYSHL